MWRRPPPRDVAEGWLAKALELSEPGTRGAWLSLTSGSLSDPGRREEAAAEALAIGNAIGNPRLVVAAIEAKTLAATEARMYDEACDHADAALQASAALSDPGYRAHHYWNTGFVYLRAGRIDRRPGIRRRARPARALDEPARRSAHDRLARAAGERARSVGGAGRARRGSRGGSRCERRLRLSVQLAHAARLRARPRSARRRARGRPARGGRQGERGRRRPAEREPALLRLSLLRGDLAATRRILEASPAAHDQFAPDVPAARLDALAALGEHERLEAEAAPFLDRPSYTRPFALRALGRVRHESSLVERAASEFEAMGLAWRATSPVRCAVAEGHRGSPGRRRTPTPPRERALYARASNLTQPTSPRTEGAAREPPPAQAAQRSAERSSRCGRSRTERESGRRAR